MSNCKECTKYDTCAKREVFGSIGCNNDFQQKNYTDADKIRSMSGDDELRILNNYIYNKPKTYRQRNDNASVVHDILLSGTYTAGRTSCIKKCIELGIDPYSHDLKSNEVK